MRRKAFGLFAQRISRALAVALLLIVAPVPIQTFAKDLLAAGEQQKQDEPDRCKFLMDKVNSIILSLNAEGKITFLNHYGRNFFGYSNDEILGKPMLGTLTPPAGFQGRDLTAFLAELVRDPNRYAYSVNMNMLRDGTPVWIFWANKGIYDQGQVQEVLRVGLDITERELRLEASTQELRDIGKMLEGRDWVQRKKLKEITSRIEAISEELERPWKETKSGVFESVAPPAH
ncbi:MAG: PAS domain-containing protein [Alphaproteobacteria bacterium]|nr:PAS domain-containing protein [Alphaproteobacteria bacterium]MBV9378992.1 PAS domain-containing protein [Alphaproteobacteria bacterium]